LTESQLNRNWLRNGSRVTRTKRRRGMRRRVGAPREKALRLDADHLVALNAAGRLHLEALPLGLISEDAA
jgi:hypothetical protein